MKTLREIIDAVQELADQGVTESRSGQWRLAQLCDHLARTTEASCPGGDLGAPLIPRWLRPLVKRIILLIRYMPSGATAPATLVPDDELSTDEAIARLTRAVETFENLSDQARSRMTPSPALGAMTYDDWRTIHLIHAKHHLKVFTGRKR